VRVVVGGWAVHRCPQVLVLGNHAGEDIREDVGGVGQHHHVEVQHEHRAVFREVPRGELGVDASVHEPVVHRSDRSVDGGDGAQGPSLAREDGGFVGEVAQHKQNHVQVRYPSDASRQHHRAIDVVLRGCCQREERRERELGERRVVFARADRGGRSRGETSELRVGELNPPVVHEKKQETPGNSGKTTQTRHGHSRAHHG